jgi:hypothetical protein
VGKEVHIGSNPAQVAAETVLSLLLCTYRDGELGGHGVYQLVLKFTTRTEKTKENSRVIGASAMIRTGLFRLHDRGAKYCVFQLRHSLPTTTHLMHTCVVSRVLQFQKHITIEINAFGI